MQRTSTTHGQITLDLHKPVHLLKVCIVINYVLKVLIQDVLKPVNTGKSENLSVKSGLCQANIMCIL